MLNTHDRADLRLFLAARKIKDVQKQVTGLVRALRTTLDQYQGIIDRPQEYTGWFVLLKNNPETESKYTFVGFYNPEISDQTEPEWELAIPIPVESSINEFIGW